MNLYRSFGNLMEAWVTEGNLCSDPEWLGNHDEDSAASSTDMGTNLRSESVDSGVETPSSDTSFPATSCSISTDNAEIDTFTQTSTSQSPLLSSSVPPFSSSSSPHICPSRAQEGSTVLHLKVEQTLQRADCERLKDNPEPVTVDEVLRRRPRTSFLSKRQTSNLARGQRSQSLGPRRTVNPSVPVRQMSEIQRRPLSLSCGKQAAQTRSEDLGEEARTALSPGLNYLEQVCQMLEEIARQQMHNRALQMEMDALQEHQDTQAPDTCQGVSKALEENISSCQSLENEGDEQVSCEPHQQKDYPYRNFRQRSASYTSIETLHSRKLKADCKGQHLSTDDLLKKAEEDGEKQECKKGETNKTNKNWRLKIGSLRRDDSGLKDTKSQQMQSSEKNSTRRRLSKLFRRRRKTLPA
ncbi:serine-rich adhesin for platelets [Thunnus thynnus]|uniref:serine-rich adhesin for platelets n=1 Tax=Thunnus thynnus TaxID=8237 RepID=UPI003527EEA8